MNKIPPEELSGTLHYLAECVMFAERIGKQTCCNTCGKLKTCEYCPEWGEPTRINCPLWEKYKGEPMDRIDKFLDDLEKTFAYVREREGGDSVCGLCEYDGAYIGESGDWCNECPGFNKDDCFKLSGEIRKKWTDEILAICKHFGNDSEIPNSSDCISRQAAIDIIEAGRLTKLIDTETAINGLKGLPPAQPEPTTEIQEILNYLDTTLHPIVSPDNWNVYAELHDMVSKLPSTQPEQLESEDVTFWKKRAREYEEMIGELTTEMARGVKVDSVLITEEGIAFKKKKPEQRWIPCSETVDTPDHEVMACDRYGAFIIGYLDCKDEQWLCESDDSIMYDPVAWCELPKPYKEEGI